jgi:O-methyltransferase
VTPELLKKYPIISDQVSLAELQTILRELGQLLKANTPGNIVEFGCYIGTTSLFIRRLLDHYKQSDLRSFHVYDSFEGLPAKVQADQNAAGVDFQAGELFVSKKQFQQQFQRAKLRMPVVHKAWFDQLLPADVPKDIAFAFLDGDFYESIFTSLQLVWPRLAEQATVLIHDYKRETLPGVERAINDFLRDKPAVNIRGEHNIAIIKVKT